MEHFLQNQLMNLQPLTTLMSSQKLDWVLNMSLILSSNVIWHAYRLIAETKIFRLGGSLSHISSMLRKNKLAKKYNTERYI